MTETNKQILQPLKGEENRFGVWFPGVLYNHRRLASIEKFLMRLVSVSIMASGVYNPHFHASSVHRGTVTGVSRPSSSNLSIKRTLGTYAICRVKSYLHPVSPAEFFIIFQSMLRFMCTSRSVFLTY